MARDEGGWVCARCGWRNPSWYRFCSNCGAERATDTGWVCPSCGKKVPSSTYKFCIFCGHERGAEARPAAEARPEAKPEARIRPRPRPRRIVGRPLSIRLPGIKPKPLPRGTKVVLSRPIYGGPEPPVIEALIGSGGMAEVYLATLGGRKVAVKMPLAPRPWETLEPEEQERFLKEAKLLAGIKPHPNVVALLAYGIGPWAWIALELMEGGSLKAVLSQYYPKGLPVREAVLMGIQLADAVDHIHHYGIVHRDIKPGNILFTADGVPKLADLGLAKLMLSVSEREQKAEVGIGTPPYLAPEQVDPDAYGKVDWRTDIWQLGVVLYEALTGQNPFTAETATKAEIKARIIGPYRPEPPSQLRPDAPGELDEVLTLALAKDKEGRYQSAAELKNELLLVLEGLERP